MTQREDRLGQVLTQVGAGWLLQQGVPGLLDQLLTEIDQLSSALTHELGTTRNVFDEIASNPDALRPLIQLFTSPTSTPIRAAAYCVLRGMSVKTVAVEYELGSAFALSVVVEEPQTGRTHTFESETIWDLELLKHMGIMQLGTKPVLTGLYASDS